MKHVIIGAGAAGISAAKTIRKFQAKDEIVIISTDDAVYSRCMLHNYISGERDKKAISFIDDNFFADNNIRWISDTAVTDIDATNKIVKFAKGSESYDKLLIASGSECTDLPILKSNTPKNVLSLRHLSDAKAIKESAKDANNIIIIGAGLVGLDAAYALLDTNKKPTVIDMANSILDFNLDSYAAGVYQQKFEDAGCTFQLGQRVDRVDTDSSKNVTALTLDSGKKLPCDLVIVAIGSYPAVGFLKNSGVDYSRGITVDKYLSTNIKDIYAAGDVTGLSSIWPNAVKQGEIAAKNMCNLPTIHDDKFADKNTINYFGIPTLSLGDVTSGDGTKIQKDRSKYKKINLRNGLVVGVILQGDIANSGFWQYLIKNNVDVSQINSSIFNLSFADFYGLQENGEYQWSV